jgi:hypothetical protein
MKISPSNKARLLTIGEDVSTKELVFRAYAEGLDFPPYFSGNWDSFEECLADLNWLQSEIVLIYHKGWSVNPLRHDNMYVDIIEGVAQDLNSRVVLVYD